MKTKKMYFTILIACAVFAVSCEVDKETKETEPTPTKSVETYQEKVDKETKETEPTPDLRPPEISLRSDTLKYKEKFAKHRKLLEEALEELSSSPKDKKAELYFSMGYNHSELGYLKSLIEYEENKLWGKHPDDPAIIRFHVTAEKNFHDAIESFDKAIALENNHVLAYIYRGIAKMRLLLFKVKVTSNAKKRELLFLENFKRLREDFDKAIEIKPNIPNSYFYRSMLYAIKSQIDDDNYAQALEDVDEAIKLSPKAYPEYYFMKSIIYGEMKDTKRFCEYQNQAIKVLKGSNPEQCSLDETIELARKFEEMLFLFLFYNRERKNIAFYIIFSYYSRRSYT